MGGQIRRTARHDLQQHEQLRDRDRVVANRVLVESVSVQPVSHDLVGNRHPLVLVHRQVGEDMERVGLLCGGVDAMVLNRAAVASVPAAALDD